MFPFPFSFISGVAPDVPVERIANAKVMSFNGTDQYVDNEIINLGANCTVSAWFKPTTSSTDYVLFGSSSLGSSYLLRYYLGSFYVSTGGGFYLGFSIGGNTVVNSWNYLAIEKTTDTITMYLKNQNGEFSQSSTNSGISALSLSFDRIGAKSTNPASVLFTGQVDEVALFNTALSASKIQQIYDATAVVGGVPQTANLFTGGLSSSLVYWNRMGDS